MGHEYLAGGDRVGRAMLRCGGRLLGAHARHPPYDDLICWRRALWEVAWLYVACAGYGDLEGACKEVRIAIGRLGSVWSPHRHGRLLPYLCQRLAAAGGELHQRLVTDLDQAARLAPVVVNATVLGARDLTGDSGLTRFAVSWSSSTVLALPSSSPRTPTGLPTCCICTRMVTGRSSEASPRTAAGDLEPDENTAQTIIERCATIDSRISNQPVRAHRVGLRPTRRTIRCETDPSVAGYRLLHNYGQGGAGVSQSWGCANETHRLSGRM
jgi:hypothetical protein